jgi:peptidoglycan/xylan/chitin deacetylase (PgdA/CDA1 family)
MPAYQRYGRYQRQRTASNGQIARWLLYLIILAVIIWLISGFLNRGDKQEAPILANANSNENTNSQVVNGNANVNSNTNSTVSAAAAEAFDVEADCEGTISQYGNKKQVALTFGGRGDGGNVADVLKVLKDSNAPASFFFTGTFAKNHSDVVKAVSDAGFRVYNQSDTNQDFETITEDEALQELEQADEKISAVTGLTSKPFFRPPYGSVDDAVTKTVKSAGYCPVTWTVDGLDWQADSTSESVRTRVVDRAVKGEIIMLHVGSSVTPAALQGIITDLRDQGYEFVSLGQLITG